jgi:hypothetical protein
MNFRLPILACCSLASLFAPSTILLAATPAAGEVAAVESAPGQPASDARLSSERLNALIAAQPGAAQPAGQSDAEFLRRLSFDLIGRQPTLEEQQAFAANASPDRDQQTIERLLASEEFGINWANYWSDTIAYRVPPPELTYLNYTPLKQWLAARLNENAPWNEIVHALVTATGKVNEVPPATFVGYHAADPTNLAGETSRIFLGQHIGCAQCHDHPFDRWKRSQFHELAAFFVRAKSKLPWNDGGETLVSAVEKGEYSMPDMEDPRKKGSQMQPTVLDGDPLGKGKSDAERREELSAWLTARENPWFAKALTNRLWARTMGRGFYEPVDDLGDANTPLWPDVHAALSEHFKSSGYDLKDMFRLIVGTGAYRRGVRTASEATAETVAEAPLRLRGDEVFAALSVGIQLPNHTPPKVEPTPEIRFPPPPKSTRDLINAVFGNDPSFAPVDAPRTMSQALWMMNNEQLQAQINAAPDSGTMLAKLLVSQTDDAELTRELYRRVLAREATESEISVALDHVKSLGERSPAFEDLLWGLVNSTEFTTRR